MSPSRVAIIGTDFPVYELYCPNWLGMKDGLTRLGIEHHLFSCRPTLNIDALVEYAPDFIVYGLVDMVKEDKWRHEIRARLPHAKIVMWYGDYRDRVRAPQIKADMSEIDLMFVSNAAQGDFYEERWKVPRCLFLPLGSPIFDRPINQRYAFDFVFIGGLITGGGFTDRARTMMRYRDNGLKIIDGDARRPALRAKVFKAMPQIYRSSKVVLDQSHFTDVEGYTSNRHWIITASGGFALTKRFPRCEEFYPEGTRAYFDTFEESLALRDYYLHHPVEREEIRMRGHAHARHHTYDKRFEQMFYNAYE